MEEKELLELINQDENERIEFKETPSLDDKDEIARQLVSFTNRFGGWLIIGVKDDGSFEGAKINVDKHIQTISNIARNKCSPKIDFSYENFRFNEGDVLCINIKRRREIPHAVVQRRNGKVKSRTYYIRANNSCRLVDDIELEWLFKNVDPNLEYKGRIYLIYRRGDLKLPAFDLPLGSSFFISFVNSLPANDIEYLKKDEERIADFLVEIAPFAVLSNFSWEYGHSWLIERIYKKGRKEVHPLNEEIKKDKINIKEIEISDNFLISSLSLNFKKIPIKSDIAVPKNTSVKVELDRNKGLKKSYLKIEKEDAFNFLLEFEMESWGAGIYGHPEGARYNRINKSIGPSRKIEDIIASIMLRMNFKGDFAFPDVKDPSFNEHHHYGKSIIEMLEKDWDWDKFVESLPESKLYIIEDKIDEIIGMLQKRQ